MIKKIGALAVTLLIVLSAVLMMIPDAGATNALPPNTDITAGTEADTFPFNIFDGINIGEAGTTSQIIILLTILTILPSILLMLTSFTRIIIVFSFLRNAMGTMQMPPNQVLIGLSLFLTLFIMWPVFDRVNQEAIAPFDRGEIAFDQMLTNSIDPFRDFMFEQIEIQGNQSSLQTFINLADVEQPENMSDIPTHVLIPAFITSEIKTAFKIGFLVFVPFIVIDMIVASALMSMGMMMLPPVMIALPFKIMVFVLVDGWNLIVNTMVLSFRP